MQRIQKMIKYWKRIKKLKWIFSNKLLNNRIKNLPEYLLVVNKKYLIFTNILIIYLDLKYLNRQIKK